MSVSADSQAKWLGYTPISAPNAASIAINGANVRQAMSFIAPSSSRTITKVYQYCSVVSGTVATSECKVELQGDSAGSPDNTPVETVNCDVSVAVGVLSWTLNTALTPGVRYWIVTKNTNASPGTNNFTLRYGGSATSPMGATTDATVHWARRTSTDASTWATGSNNSTTGLMVGYDDGSYDGYPFHNYAITAVGDGIYGARELGNVFTTPSFARLRVRGVRMHFGVKTGTPTGTPFAKIYEGTTLLSPGTSRNLYTTVQSTAVYELWFDKTYTLTPDASHRITIAETTQSDASGNRYNLREYSIFDNAQAKSLMPFAGTMQKVYFDGSTWQAAVDTSIIPMELLLDPMQPFDSAGDGYLLVSN